MEKHQNTTDVQDNGAGSGEGTPKVIKAGSEAKGGRRVVRSGNQVDVSDHGTAEVARSVLRAGQEALEGAEGATQAAVDGNESTGAGQVLGEWASFTGRAALRSTQAMGDLMHCYTLSGLLQWQSNLLSATVIDWVGTNARILRLVTHKA